MLDATDPPLSVRPLLDEMSAVADRVHWFMKFRLSVIDKPGDLVDSPEDTLAPLVATYDVLEKQVAKTDEALAALARHYGKVEKGCPPDLTPYFDWLIDEAHALINESVLTDRDLLMKSSARLVGLAKLLRQVAADPLDALKRTPAAFKDDERNRLSQYVNSRSEWPQPIDYLRSFAVSHRLGLRYGEHWAFTKHLESTGTEQEAESSSSIEAAVEQLTVESTPLDNDTHRAQWASQPSHTPRPKRGRTPKSASDSDVVREKKLALHWESAHSCGTSKKEFARSRGIKIDELKRLLDRVRKRDKVSAVDSETIL